MQRDIKIRSLLQQKLVDSSAAKNVLSRKQINVTYTPEKVFILCVHANTLPFLELYGNEQEVISHHPQKVIDLISCSFVSKTIEDDRSFVIGFEDPARPQLELTALSSDECENWVRTLNTELPKVNCLPLQNNLYVLLPFNQTTSSQNGIGERFSFGEPYYESIASTSATRQNDEKIYSSLPNSPTSDSNQSQDRPPLLPSRTLSINLENRYSIDRISNDFYDHLPIISNDEYNTVSPKSSGKPENAVETSVTEGETSVENPGSYYNVSFSDQISPSDDATSIIPEGYSSIGSVRPVLPKPKVQMAYRNDEAEFRNDCNNLSLLPEPAAQLVESAPPLPNRNLVNVRETRKSIEKSSLPESANLPSKRLSLKEVELLKLKRDIDSDEPIKVVVNAEAVVRGLALVEMDSAIWVAGWSVDFNKMLRTAFHVGDKVTRINGKPFQCKLDAVKWMLNSMAFTGSIEMTLKRMPLAKAFILKRSVEGEDLGIVRKKNKNEITEIRPDSLTAQAGLVGAKTRSYSNPTGSEVNWFITEVNGRPLSIFASNNEAGERLSAIGLDVTLVVQPLDFVKCLRQCLKQQRKNFKDFVIAC